MGTLYWFVFIYVVGGITFVPVVLCCIFIHTCLTLPHVRGATQQAAGAPIGDSQDDGENIRSGKDAVETEKVQHDDDEKESAGYFAVCREWIPGGIILSALIKIDGKPPERITPAGEVIAGESPSVYQSMYRSLFDRKQAPTMDVGRSGNTKSAKRARNVFYVVLRHGHLMLYDDSEQVEVRHVISLAHHNVSIYGGDEEIPEGELWIKRNAIRLTRKSSADATGPLSKPFYLFSENCSDKEDFYFALLQSQGRDGTDRHTVPLAQHFDINHIVGLVQSLHSSEETLQARWLNALVGRLFLSVYRTQEIEDYIRLKITKKISRVNKPSFLSGIVLKKIETGSAAPFVTNPRMKDITLEGECCVEMDIAYSGNFRIEVATTARIDLGARFKAREVDLVLAITLKKLEGHLLVRFKPLPSNRIWITFDKMPNLTMDIEPIVSSRQITYGIILRAIENRIREVVAETLVFPHWDDSPYLSTAGQNFRGGIWVDEQSRTRPSRETFVPDYTVESASEKQDSNENAQSLGLQSLNEASMSSPTLVENYPSLSTRDFRKPMPPPSTDHPTMATTGASTKKEPPRAMRSKSFAAAASPIVSTDHVNSRSTRTNPVQSRGAANYMTELSNRSQPGSPNDVSLTSYTVMPLIGSERRRSGSIPSSSSRISDSELNSSQGTLVGNSKTLYSQSPSSLSARSTASSLESTTSNTWKLPSVARGLTPSEKKQQTIIAAAAAAKNWGWKTLTKGKGTSLSTPERSGTPENPIGRGRPLPPPGQPLPLPDKNSSTTSFALPRRISKDISHNTEAKPKPIPLPRRRQPNATESQAAIMDGVLIVEAPQDSEPSSPADGEYGEFMDSVRSDDEDSALYVDTQHQINDYDLKLSGHDEDAAGILSWHAAQEEHERSRAGWMDEQEHP